jgi:hypothetical protein
MSHPQDLPIKRLGWRVPEWGYAVGCGRSFTYELIQKGEVESVKVAGMRLITTEPAEFIARFKQAQAAA